MSLDIQSERTKICRRHEMTILDIMDTNKHEPDKDVTLCQLAKKRVILRIGETRVRNFFPQGHGVDHGRVDLVD